MSTSLGEVLRRRALDSPDDEFVTCAGRTLTFGELSARADTVGHGLLGAGLGPGDHLAVILLNRLEMVELYFGAARAGLVQVPLNAFLKGDFLQHQLLDSQATALVVDAEGLEAVIPLLAELPGLALLVTMEPAPRRSIEDPRIPKRIQVVSYAEVTGGKGVREVELPTVTGSSVMSIMYTSGTTGLPKGCVLAHAYYLRAARSVIEMLDVGEGDRLYSTLPLFHAGGRMLTLATALVAGRPVAIDSAFSPSGILDRCRETRSTLVIGMGVMGTAMLAAPASPRDRDHSVRAMIMVPLGVELQERFQERFGIDPFVEAFGQTECMPVFAGALRGPRRRESCGLPVDDLDVALLDSEGNEVLTGEVGEICIRPRVAHATFEGYWTGNGVATLLAADGWHHTGDNGRRLGDGSYAFSDRRKDSLRRRGENVSSMELEAAILAHPGIAEAAVVAVPSELGEDDIKASLVASQELTAAELFAFFAANLPYFAIPRYVELVPALPRNAVGRVMKHRLRATGITAEDWDFEALGMRVARRARRAVESPET